MGKIKKVYVSDDSRPVIAHFQNGAIERTDEKNLKSALLRKKDGTTVVAVENLKTHILYASDVDRKENLLTPFICVHNKRTNKMRLVQSDVVTLAPYFKKNEDNLNITVTDYQKSTSELNKEFGSKRSKAKTEQNERLKMNIDVVKEQLEKTVANITLDESDLTSATKLNENQSYYKPHINRIAENREQVYNLHHLLPESVLETLEQEAETVLNADSESLTDFVRAIISKLNKTDSECVKKCCILLYVNYVIQFLRTPVMKLKRLVLSESQLVNDHIFENFSINSSTGRTRPFSMRDKAVCNILVLLMFAMNFEVPIEQLATDLKIGMKKILEIGRILAFTVKDKSTLVLKLPLPASVNPNAKAKRK